MFHTEWGHTDALVSDRLLEGGGGERGAGMWPRGRALDLSLAPGCCTNTGRTWKMSTFQSDTCGQDGSVRGAPGPTVSG